MKKQIVVRAFYGWLLYHRHLKTVGTHLIGLVNSDSNISGKFCSEYHETIQKKLIESIKSLSIEQEDDISDLNDYISNNTKLDVNAWHIILNSVEEKKPNLNQIRMLFFKIVYLNGIEPELRKQVWPFLREHYTFDMNQAARSQKDEQTIASYTNSMNEWLQAEETIKLKEKNKSTAKQNSTIENDSGISINDPNNASTLISPKSVDLLDSGEKKNPSINRKTKHLEKMFSKDLLMRNDSAISNEVFSTDERQIKKKESVFDYEEKLQNKKRSFSESDLFESSTELFGLRTVAKSIVDQIIVRSCLLLEINSPQKKSEPANDPKPMNKSFCLFKNKLSKSCFTLASNSFSETHTRNTKIKFTLLPQSSIESQDVIDCFAINMHRIDKDVTRCDRNYWYFSSVDNLNKLKNIIYT